MLAPNLKLLPLLPLMTASAGLLVLYLLYLAVYRLFFHPLVEFPGPRIAALTSWYECYYDVFKPGGGMYMWEIQKMHRKYGPVVRINPDELHFIDMEFRNTIYASPPQKRDRYYYHTRAADLDNVSGFTVDHDVHKKRRDAIAPFFTKRVVQAYELDIQAKIQQFCEIIDNHYKSRVPINLTVISLGMCIDIISKGFFGEDDGIVRNRERSEQWKNEILFSMRNLHVTCHFAWLATIMRALPLFLLGFIAPNISGLFASKESIRRQAQNALSNNRVYSLEKMLEKRTIFQELRNTAKLPLSDRTIDRITDESFTILIAGVDNPAKIIALILYHLMMNSDKLERVRAEIAPLMSSTDLPSSAQLQQLPYFSAAITEGYRLHGGSVWRSQRISREPLPYKDFVIPAGTPMSSSSYFTHYNEDIFPRARDYLPERWIEAQDGGKNLKKYLLVFGRGSRSCIGHIWADVMVHLSVAAVLMNFDLMPYETDDRDVELQRDWTLPMGRPDSKGVRATVLRKRAL